jgi:hypothetical protein
VPMALTDAEPSRSGRGGTGGGLVGVAAGVAVVTTDDTPVGGPACWRSGRPDATCSAARRRRSAAGSAELKIIWRYEHLRAGCPGSPHVQQFSGRSDMSAGQPLAGGRGGARGDSVVGRGRVYGAGRFPFRCWRQSASSCVVLSP